MLKPITWTLMENQMLFSTITESHDVSVLKVKSLGREGREALDVAVAEREVKGARWGEQQCLPAPRVAVRNRRNGDHIADVAQGSWRALGVSIRPWDTEGN